MPVTESQRHQLYEALKEQLGQPSAETFMNLMPPTDWDTVATKDDIARLDDRLSARIDGVAAEIARLDDRLSARIDALEVTTGAHIDRAIAESKTSMLKILGTWLFASQAAVVATVAMIVAVAG
jgi:hypothetical protein